MDQGELRKIENRCIQEQPPGCIAACPLHVDVRTFIRHLSEKKWDEAWKVLQKTLPFPGIMGRICDAPCQNQCKRSEAGGAVLIGALERFLRLTASTAQVSAAPALSGTKHCGDGDRPQWPHRSMGPVAERVSGPSVPG